MNKSKFLKKSLAMLLAVMLVVAMIPLSASAATAPEITSVTVNTVVAKVSSDKTFSAEITNPGLNPVTAAITLKDGVGSVYHASNDATANGVTTMTFTSDEVTAKSAKFSLFDADNKLVGTYTINFTVAAKDNDVSVKSITVAGQYGDTKINGTTYTITVPYNTTGNVDAKVVLNSAKSHVDSQPVAADATYTITNITPNASTATPVVVTSEAGATKTYSIKVVKAKAFTSFSVKGERKAADIYGVTENVVIANNTVVVHMPYGTVANAKGKFKFIPTFVTGYSSVEVKATKLGDTTPTTIKSGVEIDLADFVALTADTTIDTKTIPVTVNYTGSVSENWSIVFEVPANDPVPTMNSLKIGAYVGTITDRAVAIELPETVRKTATTITVGASTGAVVDVVGTAITATANASGVATLTFAAGALADGKNTFTLRVTAAGNADGSTSKDKRDYNLTIKTAAPKQAQVTTMILENPAADKKVTAEIDHSNNKITFNIPYSVKAVADLQNWKLYYEITSGAVISGYTAASGEKLTGSETIFPAAGVNGFDGKTAGATQIVVATEGLSQKSYQVFLKNTAANNQSTMSGFKVSTKDKFADVMDSNSYAATGSTDLTVSIPYSKTAEYDTAFVTATLPEGAKLYYVDSKAGNVLRSVDVLTEDVTTAATAKLPSIATYKYDGTTKNADGKLTPLTLVVVSEAVTVVSGTTVYDASHFIQPNVGNFTAYTLTVKAKAANTAAQVKTLSVYDATSKTRGTATIAADNTLTITMPYFFDASKAGRKAELYLDYTVTGGEGVVANPGASSVELKPLTFKKDGTVDKTASTALFATVGATEADNKLELTGNTQITSIKATSEDGKASATYNPIVVKFATAEKGASLSSVSIGGKSAVPDASNKVTVNLTYGTEVTHLVPTFSISTNAFVSVKTGVTTAVVTPGDSFNFSSAQTFIVTSEDSSNSTTYTIEVTTDAQFSDVKVGDWFYDAVMEAAAKGIVYGEGNGRFNPQGNVTRAQFAAFMARVDGYDKDDYIEKTPFSDVKGGTELSAAIAYCAEKGYMKGYGDTTFKPNQTITREEMSVVLCTVLGLNKVETPKAAFADDAKISGWAKPYVYACAENKILSGVGNNKFDPKAFTTRAQAAVVSISVLHAK